MIVEPVRDKGRSAVTPAKPPERPETPNQTIRPFSQARSAGFSSGKKPLHGGRAPPLTHDQRH
jgi:hypothetical protein